MFHQYKEVVLSEERRLVRFEFLEWDTRETAQRAIVTQNSPRLQASGLAPVDPGSRLGFQPAEALRANDFAP